MNSGSVCSDRCEWPTVNLTPAASFSLADARQLASRWERVFGQLEQTLADSVPFLYRKTKLPESDLGVAVAQHQILIANLVDKTILTSLSVAIFF